MKRDWLRAEEWRGWEAGCGKGQLYLGRVENGHAWCIWIWGDKAGKTGGLTQVCLNGRTTASFTPCPGIRWAVPSRKEVRKGSQTGEPHIHLGRWSRYYSARSPLGSQTSGSQAPSSSRGLRESCHHSWEHRPTVLRSGGSASKWHGLQWKGSSGLPPARGLCSNTSRRPWVTRKLSKASNKKGRSDLEEKGSPVRRKLNKQNYHEENAAMKQTPRTFSFFFF